MGQLDRLMDKAGKAAGSAARITGTLVGKGRDKARQMTLQAKLAKLHRQLGALVYALRKNEDENEPMVAWYIAEIDRVKAQLVKFERPEEDPLTVYGGEVQEDAMFCGRSGK